MDDRQLARAYSISRIVFGSMFVLIPRLTLRLVFGADQASQPAARWLAKAVGVRDAILGVGALTAIERGQSPKQFLQYAAASDAIDALATLSVYGQLPRRRRFLLLLAASGGAATGLALARR